MLSILNTLCHGYVGIPVIQACRVRQMFAPSLAGQDIRFSDLVKKFSANPGYLKIALSMLETLDLANRNSEEWQLGGSGDLDVIPGDILDLYRFAPAELLVDPAAQSQIAWWLAAVRVRNDRSNRILVMLEGAILLHLLIALKQADAAESRRLPESLRPELRRELAALFAARGWGAEEDGGFRLLGPGVELIQRAYVMAIALSYRPMLARVEDLIFGNSAAVFDRKGLAAEAHVDRQMNVVASGFQHQRYFKDAEYQLLSVFDDTPLERQPRYVADIGCGDGSFLKSVYEVIQSRTRRGQNLDRYPLLMLGVDYNDAALVETEKTLSGIPHLTLFGDIGKPQQIVDDLRKQGITDPENTLYVRSFLDHNFHYAEPAEPAGTHFPLPAGSQYVDGRGEPVEGLRILEAWRAHLQRWASIDNPHGFVVLESHCLPPAIANRYFERTESFYFDAVHALSGQYLIEAEAFVVLAATVGLFPKEPPFRYPKTLPFCRITLSHFEKRDYRIRHANTLDMPALVDIERQCWSPQLQTPELDLLSRLKTYPQGQFVLEFESRVVGVIYSQRIANEELLKETTTDRVSTFHRDDGGIVQLLALSVLPGLQGRNFGDELLKFMLQRCSVMNGVEKVCGVTVCKTEGHRKGRAAFLEYVRSRDERGALLDPNLRFHEFHGAAIGEVIEGYRPRDIENEARGVLIHYDIYNLKRPERRTGTNEGQRDAGISSQAATAGMRQFVETSIRRCLGVRRAAAFSPDRPLMEMGLDSGDLLELGELLSSRFGVALQPAFFFEHNTCNRVLRYLGAAGLSEVAPPSAAPKEGAEAKERDVAIIGCALRLPGGMETLEEFWTLLKDGQSAVAPLPAGRWEWPEEIHPITRHPGIDRGGFLNRVDLFDAAFFRISPREAELMDPQQRILLELAWHAIEDAGYSRAALADTSTGVFIGASGSDYVRLMEDSPSSVNAYSGTGTSMAILANRLSYFFDFHGPSLQIDTACSSSLVALHSAVQSLRSGESAQALVGGIHVMCHPANTIAYYKAGMLSHDGACKTLDSRADGYVRAEGAVMMLLKPLKAAEADRDPIYAVIKGTAINHGGQASGLTVPNPEKQARLLEAAWNDAAVAPGTIGYIEMHGTGTPLGDPIEVDGIKRAFSRAGLNGDGACGLGSVKTNLGHLEAAAGIAGLLKVALSLRHRQLLPTVHLKEINPHIQLAGSSLRAVRTFQEWERVQEGLPLRAGVSSFGFGGANAHAVLEEYLPPLRATPDTTQAHLFVLSARTPERLRVYAAQYVQWLSAPQNGVSLRDLAYTLQAGRDAMDSRLAFVASDKAEIISKLKRFCAPGAPQVGYFHNTLRFDAPETPRSSSESDIREAAGEGDLEGIANLWVSGAGIPWNALSNRDNGTQPERIHIPTYPFAPVPHWLPENAVNAVLHPLLHRNVSAAGVTRFTSTFTGRECFLKDHLVGGQRTLPGVAFLEMARKASEIAAGAAAEGRSSVSLKSVIWTRPLRVESQPGTVYFECTPNGGSGNACAVYSVSNSSTDRTVHAQGTVGLTTVTSIPVVDLRVLQENCRGRAMDTSEFYALCRTNDIEYGPAHQGVRELALGAHSALARIILPPSVFETSPDFFLHPSVVDCALQVGMVLQLLLESTAANRNPLLPFAVEGVDVFSATQTEMWVWARFDESKLDIDLIDEHGNVCVAFRSLRLRRAQNLEAMPEDSATAPPALLRVKPVWTACRPGSTEGWAKDRLLPTLVLGAADASIPALRAVFPNSRFAETASDRFELGQVAHLVWCAPEPASRFMDSQALVDEQQTGVFRLFDRIKAVLQQEGGKKPLAWTVCTMGSQSVLASDRVEPAHAGVHGLVGSMAKEFPNWRVRLVDLESIGAGFVAPLLNLPDEAWGQPLACRRGQWFRRKLIPVAGLAGNAGLLREGGVYVVVGGAGGIGEAWSRWLIERYRAQLVWIGRRPLDDSIQRRIDSLGTPGPAPCYVSADAGNLDSLEKALAGIKRRFPAIHGVVHSAIVLADASLARMTRSQFATSLNAQLEVCARMGEVFAREKLDFALFFSSIESFSTFGGQSNYAAGCTFKDAFADRLRREWKCPVKVVNWGYWGSIGAVASEFYRESMAQKGFGSIEPREAFEVLEQFLNSPVDQLAVLKALRSGAIEERESESIQVFATNSAVRLAEHWLPQAPELEAAAKGGLSVPELDSILAKLLWATVQSVGFSGRAEAPLATVLDALNSTGNYERWAEESLAVLERENLLHIDRDRCIATDPTLLSMEDVWREWESASAPFRDNPHTRSQVQLLGECLRNLPEILAGRLLATDVIFSNSSSALVAGVYKGNPIADYFNRTLASVVGAYLEARLTEEPSARFRILEVGAGTGGTTKAVLERLAPLRSHIEEYCFSDISPAFLLQAKAQFGPEWPNLATQRFDVENPLRAQSVAIGAYDVVIAANALHATRDIRETVRNAKAALRPDGLLALNELVSNSLFLHLTFGLLKGWWLYEDPALRIQGCPGLNPDEWRHVLESEGLRAVAFPADHALRFGQQIIVAQSDGIVRQRRPQSLAAAAPASETVPATTAIPSSKVNGQMLEQGIRTVIREAIAASLKMDESEIQDGRVFSDYGVDSIIGVELIHQINQRCKIGMTATVLFDYGTVRELSRYIATQLKPALSEAAEAWKIAAPAVVPPSAPAVTPVSRPADGTCQRLLIERPGQISDTRVVESPVPPLGVNDVRIAVRACSLNFSDLLCVKGLYPHMPEYPFTPGLEASGVVVAVGEAVQSTFVGEEVVAFMGRKFGAHSTVITCSSESLLKKPAGLTFEEACSFPAVGVTMIFAFRKANIRKGESILIQTAAGGTGLVAVQLAKRCGAKIYATAGSDEKVAYLRALGVEHAINYRTTDFETELERLTQGRGVDVVLNTLGGDAIQKGLNSLSAGGRYIEVAMTALKSAKAIDLSVLRSNQSFHSVDLMKLEADDRKTFIDCYQEMLDLIEDGVLQPTIGHTVSFDRIQSAFAYLEQRRNTGKVVVSLPEALSAGPAVSAGAATAHSPIAIVGMSGRFAQSPSVDDLWQHLAAGDDLIGKVQRWDLMKAYREDGQDTEGSCYDGGLLEEIDKFDPSFFDISALEAVNMDPQQRIFLEESWKALEDAGYAGPGIEGKNCGVYVGCTSGDYSRLIPRGSPAHSFWGNAGSVIPARIAYYLNLRGPAIAIDTACSSSLVAIHMACEGLRAGETEIALAGGVFLQSTVDFYLSANRASMLSPRGRCHTFDERADGFVPGEGAGVVVLKRLKDALADGDHIYGVVRGSRLNQDGKTNGITAPSASSQQRLERQVYASCAIPADRIQMVEAHGTGTRLGDPIEFEALAQAFRKDTDRKSFCAIGSIKSNLGHAATAAGVASVLKILLSLQHRQIPPTLHFKSGNPAIAFSDSPFYVNTELKDWEVPQGDRRRAAVSSFGFSGTNAHMIIEEPPPVDRRHARREAYLVVLSGRTSEQLQAQAQRLVAFLERNPLADLGDVSFTLMVGRRRLGHRLATVVHDAQELNAYLRKWLDTGRALQVHVSEIDEGKLSEDPSLKDFGNECIRICRRTAEGEVYLSRLGTVATLFSQGYSLRFEELFAGGGYSRISLPTYPFSSERYWVEEGVGESSDSVPVARLHPLVHENCSTLRAQLYRSTFSGEESFFRDHQLHGKRLMPAVAYLEMAVVAGSLAMSSKPGDSPLRLKNVVWPSPLNSGKDAAAIAIRLTPESDTGIGYEISGNSDPHGRLPRVYCQGTLDPGGCESPDSVDPALWNRLLDGEGTANARRLYEAFRELGIAYGPSHRGVESIVPAGDVVVSRIALPEAASIPEDTFCIHPCIMDAALQTTLGVFAPELLQSSRPGHSPAALSVPYAMEEVRVYRRTERTMWAVVRRSSATGADRGAMKLDIDVCDANGSVCVAMKGLALRSVERDTVAAMEAPAGRCLFFEPKLRATAGHRKAAQRYAQRVVVLCNVRSVDEASLEAAGVRIVRPATADRIEDYYENCLAAIVRSVRDLLRVRSTGPLREGIASSSQALRFLLQVVVATDEDEADVFRALTGLSAAVRTIRQESPDIVAQLVQVVHSNGGPPRVQEIIEDAQSPDDAVIVYRSEQRLVQSWEEASLPPLSEIPWKADGIYLITGGAGGLGRTFLREICRNAPRATVVLAGRSPVSTALSADIESLRAEGSVVHYRQVDVSQRLDVNKLAHWIQTEIGPLNGVLHCAGLVRDSLCLHKTEGEIHEVLGPKVAGVVHLDEATRTMPLDFFACFSSVAGALGNTGQVDYAAANGFMDAFSRTRNSWVAGGRRFGATFSVNWPLWQDGGIRVDENVATALFQDFGMVPMSRELGLQSFSRIWTSGRSQMMVLAGDEARIRQVIAGAPESSTEAPSVAMTADSANFREKATTFIRSAVAGVLKFPLDRVKETDPFERYGIDSLLAVRLTNELEKTFGSLSKILFFEHPNIRSVTEYLVENHGARFREVLAGAVPSRTAMTAAPPPRSAPAPREVAIKPLPAKVESGTEKKEPVDSTGTRDVAIVGLSGRYPGSRTINEFWENLRAGKDCISEIPADRWDYRPYFDAGKKPGTIYSKWGGFIDGVSEFDPLFFNITPREAELMDPQERLFLQCAYETIEDAGYVPGALSGRNDPGVPANVGVFVGVMYEEYQLFGVEETLQGRPMALSGNPAAIANRVSYFCNFNGPSMVVDTMCSSSLSAIHLACQSLRLGECTAAIAGGVNVSLHPNKYLLLSQGRFASSAGRCESFGTGGDGYVPGEGVGAVLLKPLALAVRDGDHIYGVIKGTAVNHGGKTNGFTVPNPNAQAALIRQAMTQAAVHPRAISYVEAHGTGTALGDPIEIAGLSTAFRADTPDCGYCAIGSLKSNIGHCESAAGIGGVTKVLVQLQHQQLVPSLHARTLNSRIDFPRSPFHVQQELSEWKRPEFVLEGKGRTAARIAGVSSFGAGGSNAHLIIQEHQADPMPATVQEEVLIVLSARTKERLIRVVENLRDCVSAIAAAESAESDILTRIAYTLQVGRVSMEERLAFTVKSIPELARRLQDILDSRPEGFDIFRGNVDSSGGAGRAMAFSPSDWRLERLAQAWVNGADLNWESLYEVARPQRISLPTYPFARETYWAPAKRTITPAMEMAFERVVLEKAWKAAPPAGHAQEPKGTVLVLGTAATAASLAALFKAHPAVRTVNIGEASTSDILTDFGSFAAGEAAYDAIRLRLTDEKVIGLIDCTALDLDHNQDLALEFGKIRLLQLLIERDSASGLRLLQVVPRLYPFRSATTTMAGAGLAGLYRMIGAEYRRVQSSTLDVDLDLTRGSELALLIESEFQNREDQASNEVCYRDGLRYEPVLVKSASFTEMPGRTSKAAEFGPEDVILVTGGTRGLGAAAVDHLVSRGVRKLVLLGRDELPRQGDWQVRLPDSKPALRPKLEWLAGLAAKGVQVRYFNTALSDAGGLRQMMVEVHRELGAICGVLHCAGLSGENPAFIKKTASEIASVCAPKINGLFELDRVLQGDPLRFFVLFSSVAGVIPSLAAGQSEYAMANTFMDFYAMHQAVRGRRIFRAVQWPAWGETGMAVGKMEISSYTRTGLTALSTSDGMAFLDLALHTDSSVFLPAVVRAVAFDYSELLKPSFSGAASGNYSAKATTPGPTPAAPAADRASIVEWLREIFMSELKLSPDQFRETRRFDEYGVDSVMIAQLVQIMQKRVREPLSPSLLLEHASVAALADYFAAAHSGDFGTAPASSTFEVKEEMKEKAKVAEASHSATIDIAVVGISCRFPGAQSKEEYWKQLETGKCALGQLKNSRWTASSERSLHGGWLDDIDAFDPEYFRLNERDAAVMDPQARILLEQSLSALLDAGYDPADVAGSKTGVYIGGRAHVAADMASILTAPNPILALGPNYLSTNISRFFNFSGPSVVMDTACSSAITGVQFASDALRSGRIDMAMVGAVSLLQSPDAHRLFAERNILSESGEFRIFDRRASGEVLGEGAGVVLLRRLPDAIADGNQIYGVIRAVSINNDGRTLGPGSPNMQAQKQVMLEALGAAGIKPEEVGYIEVNGGGSPVVDAVELRALSEVYRLQEPGLNPCFLGSIKPNVGHLLLASGLAGLIRCVMSVHHRQIPPFLSATEPFEHYDFSTSRILFNRESMNWDVASGHRRVAAQNSYPDGGTNAHLLVEEFVPDGSYRQLLFPKPEPPMKRLRFPLRQATDSHSSSAWVTRMAKSGVLGAGAKTFLEDFASTPSNGGNGASIKTAWGEYDETGI